MKNAIEKQSIMNAQERQWMQHWGGTQVGAILVQVTEGLSPGISCFVPQCSCMPVRDKCTVPTVLAGASVSTEDKCGGRAR